MSSYAARDEEGGVTWSLMGADSGDFSIDSWWHCDVSSTLPDYETPTLTKMTADTDEATSTTFTVVATDVESGPSRRDVSVDVTVTVADVEEAGTLAVDELDIAVGDRVDLHAD